MKQFAKLKLADPDQIVLVEVQDSGRGEQEFGLAETANKTFQAALEQVRPLVTAVVERFHGISDKITEYEIEFGVALSNELNLMLVSGELQTTFKVKLKFKK
jgi:hypothetical protein